MTKPAKNNTPTPCPYESWVLRFDRIMYENLALELPHQAQSLNEPENTLGEAEDRLRWSLNPQTLLDGPSDPVENPMLPAAVTEVVAKYQAANSIIQRVFLSLFEEDGGATAYTAITTYDADNAPRLLGPISVVVVCGAYGFTNRRVLYEGEWLLEDLAASNTDMLRDLHERLASSIHAYMLHGASL